MTDRGWRDVATGPGMPVVPRSWKRQEGPSSRTPGGSHPSRCLGFGPVTTDSELLPPEL